MFARAGISGRILLNANRRGTQNSVLFKQPKPRKPKRKFRCYVPFMWSTCVAVFVGLLILMGGTAMCTVGYYAEHFSSEEVNNGTNTWSVPGDTTAPKHFRVLAYTGPVLMGCGCFTIVVACVVICETRDKMIKIMEEQEKERKTKEARKIKPNFYDLIIGQVRRDRATPSTDDGLTKKEMLKKHLMRPGSAKSVKSQYTHIGSALKRIPLDIFTIDVDGKEPTSLVPIHSAKPHTLPAGENKMSTKYPSASCLHELMVMTEDELNEIFTDSPAWLSNRPQENKPITGQTSTHHLPEKRPTLYDHETDSVYSLTVNEQTSELEKRTAVFSGDEADRPKAARARPTTESATNPENSACPRRGSSNSLITHSDNQVETSGLGNDSKNTNADLAITPENIIGGDSDQTGTDAFGATCAASDTYLALGQNGLYEESSERGVPRANSPEALETSEPNSNIVVQVAVHREPLKAENDKQCGLNQPQVCQADNLQSDVSMLSRLDSKASISQVMPSFSLSEDDRTIDSRSLIEDMRDDYEHASSSAMFQFTTFAKSTKDEDLKSVPNNSPKTNIPGNNMGKVTIVTSEPIPRPKTSLMKPSTQNLPFPLSRKSSSNLIYSRNMPRIKSATIESVGLRPIRTNVKQYLSKKSNGRPSRQVTSTQK